MGEEREADAGEISGGGLGGGLILSERRRRSGRGQPCPCSDLRPMNREVGRATGGFVPSWAGPGEGFSFVLAILFLFYLFPLFCFLLLFYF